MQSTMDRQMHQRYRQRALELGRSGDPCALPELIELFRLPSTEIRRLAASAIGKLAEFGADPEAAVDALVPVALRDRHPQVQQYALKALKNFGAAAASCLHDLEELAENTGAKDYVCVAAISAAEAIRAAIEEAAEEAVRGAAAAALPSLPMKSTAPKKHFTGSTATHASMRSFSSAATGKPESN